MNSRLNRSLVGCNALRSCFETRAPTDPSQSPLDEEERDFNNNSKGGFGCFRVLGLVNVPAFSFPGPQELEL